MTAIDDGPAVEVRDLHKTYGGRRAVRGIDRSGTDDTDAVDSALVAGRVEAQNAPVAAVSAAAARVL